MSEQKWTKEVPQKAGWYWCQNNGDVPGQVWEAVVRIEPTGRGRVVCFWLTAPGEVGTMFSEDFAPETVWAGPLSPPKSKIENRNSKIPQ